MSRLKLFFSKEENELERGNSIDVCRFHSGQFVCLERIEASTESRFICNTKLGLRF
jgi:hypothetical protein